MATFPIGDDFIYNLVSTTSFNEVSNGSQGELLPRSWPAQEQLNLQTLSSLTPLLNQTSQVSVRTWPAQEQLNLQTLSSLTPLVNQTSQVSVRTYVATSTLSMNFSGSPTCNWPTLPTTGQIWPLDNYFYDYVPPTPPPFNPLSLSPVAWWDASDASTVTAVSGDVSAWTDKSGNGWNLSQTTSGYRPFYATASINGLNTIEWPSTNNPNHLHSAAGAFSTNEIYVVVVFSGTNFDNYEGIICGYANDSGANIWLIGGTGGVDSLFGSARPAYLNGDNSTERQANVFPDIQSTCLIRYSSAFGPYSTNDGVVIGLDRNQTGFNRGWNGRICEVIAFASPLAPGDRTNLDNYLMGKWGI